MNQIYLKNILLLNLLIFNLLLVGCSTYFKNSSDIEVGENEINKKISAYGFGNLKINQLFSNELIEINNSRIDDCFMAQLKTTDKDIEFQIMNNKIAIISSMEEGRSSYAGVKIGDSEKLLYSKHQSNKFEKIRNPYGDPQKDYSIIFWNDDSKKLGIRYDIESNKVASIRVGNQNLKLMEGCA